MMELGRVAVPDASILVKWALPSNDEPGAEAAKELLDLWGQAQIEIAAPSLWTYEVGNALMSKGGSEAQDYLLHLIRLNIPSYAMTTERATQACSLVDKVGSITFYDAAYHSLAIELGGTLLTADRKYFNKANKIGNIKQLP